MSNQNAQEVDKKFMKALQQLTVQGALIAMLYIWLALGKQWAGNIVVFMMWFESVLLLVGACGIFVKMPKMPKAREFTATKKTLYWIRSITLGTVVVAQGHLFLGGFWFLSVLMCFVAIQEAMKASGGDMLSDGEKHILELTRSAMERGKGDQLATLFAHMTPETAKAIVSHFSESERLLMIALCGRELKGGAACSA